MRTDRRLTTSEGGGGGGVSDQGVWPGVDGVVTAAVWPRGVTSGVEPGDTPPCGQSEWHMSVKTVPSVILHLLSVKVQKLPHAGLAH